MKKYFALGLISLISALSFAQGSTSPVVIPDATARKISKDGKWVGCYGMSILVYNVETQKNEIYPECSLGKGNSIALDGTVVGSEGDYAALLKEGKIIVPEIFGDDDMSSINGITPDGSMIVGFVTNPVIKGNDDVDDPYEAGVVVAVPFYSEVASDASIKKINYLPYPEKDFLDNVPMYVMAEWISEDGKTIVGTMTDSYGRFEDPIVFNQNQNGEWSYSTPTKKLFNPQGIVLPENPWTKAPAEPAYKNYMTPLKYQAYLDAMQKFLFGTGPEVDPFSYMTEEMAQKYVKDYEEYENYFINHKDEIDAYEKAYREVLYTSIYFREIAMNPQGTSMATTGVHYDEEGTSAPSKVYIFDIPTGEYKMIESKYSGLKIHQMLSDGTVIAYTGLFTYDVLNGYILLPGANDFIPFAEYLPTLNKEYANWLEEVFPLGEGIVCASDDMSIIAGGVDILHLADQNLFPNSTILSYVLPSVKSAGVEAIELPDNVDSYKVFNLMGVKVLETKDKSEIKNLGKGIYIINGKKIAI